MGMFTGVGVGIVLDVVIIMKFLNPTVHAKVFKALADVLIKRSDMVDLSQILDNGLRKILSKR